MAQFKLPSIIRSPIVSVIGEKCTNVLIEQLDISHVECIKYSASKAVGLGIVVGGSIVKVPQVLLILNSRSARGLSLPAYALELVSYGINLAYNWRNAFPFSTYGETFFLTFQNVVITLLIIHYKPPSATHKYTSNTPQVALASVAIAISAVTLLLLSQSTLTTLQTLTIPIGAISKFPQIMSNARAKSTGQLSAFAVVANILGCLARVFTTLTEVQDPLVLWGFIIASVLNIVIGAQMWMYWGQEEVMLGVGDKKASEEKGHKMEDVYVPPAPKTPVTARNFSDASSRNASPLVRSESPAPGRKWARKID